MHDEIRYGFIGTGMMGCEHIRNVRELPGARPVAAADPVAASRGAAAEAADGLALFDDPRRMIGEVELDALVVSTPNHTHREVLEPVWDTDLAVMIEKPLCTTVDDCRAVASRARDHAGLVWVGLEYRYMPAIAELVRRVRGGSVGRPVMVSIREHRFPFLVKVGDWNRFNRNTGGTLVEKCCHFFDLMNVLLPGRPTRVVASGNQDVNHLDESYGGETPDILDNAFVIVDYDSGARAALDLCMFAEGSRFEQEVTVTGDRGKAEAFLPNFVELSRGRAGELVVGRREDWSVEVEPAVAADDVGHLGGHHGASFLEHRAFCDALRRGRPAEVSVEDGLWSVAMGRAAHRSIDEDRPVDLAELLTGAIGDHPA